MTKSEENNFYGKGLRTNNNQSFIKLGDVSHFRNCGNFVTVVNERHVPSFKIINEYQNITKHF